MPLVRVGVVGVRAYVICHISISFLQSVARKRKYIVL